MSCDHIHTHCPECDAVTCKDCKQAWKVPKTKNPLIIVAIVAVLAIVAFQVPSLRPYVQSAVNVVSQDK